MYLSQNSLFSKHNISRRILLKTETFKNVHDYNNSAFSVRKVPSFSLTTLWQASCQAFPGLHLFLFVVPLPFIVYRRTLALTQTSPVKLEQDCIMMGWTVVERHSRNRVQRVGERHVFVATTHYTWNSFQHLWPHVSFSSAIVSKINGNKSNPGSEIIVLLLERILPCPPPSKDIERSITYISFPQCD